MKGWMGVDAPAPKARLLGGTAVLLWAMMLGARGGSDDAWADEMGYLALAGSDEWLDAESADLTVHDQLPQ